ncbi:uncharacterized protein [Struthio camelus]|uniref:uncharacterized protein n=1 Tax=Struthio camelus TaxID=8801 RepID=UPI003603F7F8
MWVPWGAVGSRPPCPRGLSTATWFPSIRTRSPSLSPHGLIPFWSPSTFPFLHGLHCHLISVCLQPHVVCIHLSACGFCPSFHPHVVSIFLSVARAHSLFIPTWPPSLSPSIFPSLCGLHFSFHPHVASIPLSIHLSIPVWSSFLFPSPRGLIPLSIHLSIPVWSSFLFPSPRGLHPSLHPSFHPCVVFISLSIPTWPPSLSPSIFLSPHGLQLSLCPCAPQKNRPSSPTRSCPPRLHLACPESHWCPGVSFLSPLEGGEIQHFPFQDLFLRVFRSFQLARRSWPRPRLPGGGFGAPLVLRALPEGTDPFVGGPGPFLLLSIPPSSRTSALSLHPRSPLPPFCGSVPSPACRCTGGGGEVLGVHRRDLRGSAGARRGFGGI